MKLQRRKVSTPHEGRTGWFAIVMAACFFAFVAFPAVARTPDGVQCPLAPVQAVLTPVKAPCGCIVGVQSAKPKPGDKGFVQCRCAEKKSAERVTQSTSPKVDVLLSQPTELDLPGALPLTIASFAWNARVTCLAIPPTVHPPAVA